MAQVSPVPAHLHTVTPRLVVADGAAAMEFYRAAFDAEQVGEVFRMPGSGQLVHAEVRIGDAIVIVTEDDGADPDAPARSPAAAGGIVSVIMVTYWPDVDAVWQRAVAAGAEVLYPLENQFYGERGGRLRDPFGHQWALGQRIEDVSAEELARRSAQFAG